MTDAWIRRGATALGVARTTIGVVALASPSLVGRPWVGAAAEGTPGRVLARALGGRDLALGLGTLAALRQLPPVGMGQAGEPGRSGSAAGLWVGMGAIADSLDVLITVAAWDELPRISRWLVAGSAAGAAVAGGVAAWSLVSGTGEFSGVSEGGEVSAIGRDEGIVGDDDGGGSEGL